MRKLTTVTTGGTNLLSNLAWSPAGLPTGWTYGNGVTASFGWTPERLLLSEIRYDRPQPGGTMLNLTYEYGTAAGNDGRIKKINDLVVPDRTVHFEYDGLSRLKRAHTEGGATYPAWELTWGYSATGNREAQTAVVGNPPASSLAFDPATNRVNSTGWTHDLSGNVTATPDGSFSIDAAGRTIGHTPASGPSLAFAFDATGLRTKRTEGASTTLYLRDGGQVVGEWNGTSWSKEYVWLGSTLLATIEGSTIKYHHQDHLSIRATTFADGMVGEEQGHYPFGEPWYETSPETTRIFTTYEREAGGSLDYAMFRWMGPEAGRFLSADPVPGSMGDGQSWNRYAYAGNDPVNRWDPWGLMQTSPYVEVHEVWSNSPGGSSWTAIFDLFGWTFLFPDWQMPPASPSALRGRGRTGRDGSTKPPPCPPGSNIVDLASDPFASDPNVQALMWNYAQIGDAAGKEYGFLYRSSGGKNELLVGPIGSVAGPNGQPLITYPTVSGANVAAHTHDWSRLGGTTSALMWSNEDKLYNSLLPAGASHYLFTKDGVLRATGANQGGATRTDCLVGDWPPKGL